MTGELLFSGPAVSEVFQPIGHGGNAREDAAHRRMDFVLGDNGFGEVHEASTFGVGGFAIEDERLDCRPHGLVR